MENIRHFFKLHVFKILGIYVLLSVIFNLIVNYYYYDDYLEVLWMCNFIAFVLAFGLIFKNKKFLTTTLVIATPTQFLWIVDFFLELFGKGLGRTTILMDTPFLVFLLSFNLHMVIIPISFFGIYKLGFAKKTMWKSILMGALLITTTFIFTDIYTNRNCVFRSCDIAKVTNGLNKLDYINYFLINSLLFWTLVLIISYYCFSFIFSKIKKQRRSQDKFHSKDI